jgi:hypothetical protein
MKRGEKRREERRREKKRRRRRSEDRTLTEYIRFVADLPS